MAEQNKGSVRKGKVEEKSLKAIGVNVVKEEAAKKKTNSKKKVKRGRKKKKTLSNFVHSTEFPRVLRLLFLSLIMGFILYQYYLLTEGELSSSYISFWSNLKNIIGQGVGLILYTGVVLAIGYKIGRRK